MRALTIVASIICTTVCFAQSPDRTTFASQCGVADPSPEKSKLLVSSDGAWQRPQPGAADAAASEHVRVWHEKNWMLEWTAPNEAAPVLYCFGANKKLKKTTDTAKKFTKLNQLPFWGFLNDKNHSSTSLANN